MSQFHDFHLLIPFFLIKEDVGSQNTDGKNDGDEELRGTETGKTEVKIPLGDGEEVSAFRLTQ